MINRESMNGKSAPTVRDHVLWGSNTSRGHVLWGANTSRNHVLWGSNTSDSRQSGKPIRK